MQYNSNNLSNIFLLVSATQLRVKIDLKDWTFQKNLLAVPLEELHVLAPCVQIAQQ